jgi:hypothetical protein
MKTTVDIPEKLFKQLRLKAASEQTTMRELIAAALRQFLGGPKQQPPKRFRLRKASFRGEGMTSEFQSADWTKIRDEIYRGRGGEP